MGTIEGRFFLATDIVRSKLLSDFFQSFTSTVSVSLDCEHGRQIMTSGRVDTVRRDAVIRPVRSARGTVAVSQLVLGAPDLAVLQSGFRDSCCDRDTTSWQAFKCQFENGVTDIIAFCGLEDQTDAETFLSRAWPGLRHACVDACVHPGPDLSDDAMLWMISQRVNAAILVLDEQCRVLRSNAAADDILAEGRLLSRSSNGLVCASHKETLALQAAVRESYAADDDAGCEFILVLRGATGTAHFPLSLSTYVQVETGERLILAMLPRPPSHQRIEELARSMGLTPSEARVAALIREGHSNREAAEIAGLKVETFNTYAKRALSKMNVRCRAEMAQMLTWQAALERS